MKVLIVFLLLSICQVLCRRYDNYKVVDVHAETEAQLKYLSHLMNTNDKVDFMRGVVVKGVNRVIISPQNVRQLLSTFKSDKISFKVSEGDFQSEVDEERRAIEERRGMKTAEFDLDNYNTVDDIYAWMEKLHCPPGYRCKTYSIGSSHLGKPIKALKIERKGGARKSWYVDATTHAREWITTGTICKIIDRLMAYRDNEARRLVNDYNWYIVPVVNPDGYEYSMKSDRVWRKNRNPFRTCVGVDLNRNFNSTNWGKEGSSSFECTQTYMGPSAGSEKEAEAVTKELTRIAATTVVALTLHSYGNMYLLPFGNSKKFNGNTRDCDFSSDHDEIMKAVHPMADATGAIHNTKWARGNACKVIYPTSGSTDDLSKELNIKYSICAELRGNSFILPPSQIHPSFLEIFEGIIALSKHI